MRLQRINNQNKAAQPNEKTDFAVDGKPLSAPNCIGMWCDTKTGEKVKVISKEGKLYFAAGEYEDTETPVSVVAGWREFVTKDKLSFVKLSPIIDIEATSTVLPLLTN